MKNKATAYLLSLSIVMGTSAILFNSHKANAMRKTQVDWFCDGKGMTKVTTKMRYNCWTGQYEPAKNKLPHREYRTYPSTPSSSFCTNSPVVYSSPYQNEGPKAPSNSVSGDQEILDTIRTRPGETGGFVKAKDENTVTVVEQKYGESPVTKTYTKK